MDEQKLRHYLVFRKLRTIRSAVRKKYSFSISTHTHIDPQIIVLQMGSLNSAFNERDFHRRKGRRNGFRFPPNRPWILPHNITLLIVCFACSFRFYLFLVGLETGTNRRPRRQKHTNTYTQTVRFLCIQLKTDLLLFSFDSLSPNSFRWKKKNSFVL